MAIDRRVSHEHGAVAVMVAILLPALIGVAGLVIDGGELMLSRARLQTAADAAALAAASFVGQIRSGSHSPQARPVAGSLESLVRSIAQRNWRTDAPLVFTVESGRWNAAARRMAPTHDQPDAVAVHVHSTLPTRLAGALGVRRWTISAHAVAALPPLGSVPAGTVTLPLGLVSPSPSGSLLNGHAMGHARHSSSCTVRLSFESQGQSGAMSRDGLSDLQAGHSRVRVIGDGRTLTMEEIIRSNRQQGASLPREVVTVVPVIEADRCPVPSGWHRVTGFATVRVSAARSSPSRAFPIAAAAHPEGPGTSIDVQFLTDHVAQGRGNGPDFGTKATSPVLVQ